MQAQSSSTDPIEAREAVNVISTARAHTGQVNVFPGHFHDIRVFFKDTFTEYSRHHNQSDKTVLGTHGVDGGRGTLIY